MYMRELCHDEMILGDKQWYLKKVRSQREEEGGERKKKQRSQENDQSKEEESIFSFCMSITPFSQHPESKPQ